MWILVRVQYMYRYWHMPNKCPGRYLQFRIFADLSQGCDVLALPSCVTYLTWTRSIFYTKFFAEIAECGPIDGLKEPQSWPTDFEMSSGPGCQSRFAEANVTPLWRVIVLESTIVYLAVAPENTSRIFSLDMWNINEISYVDFIYPNSSIAQVPSVQSTSLLQQYRRGTPQIISRFGILLVLLYPSHPCDALF
jgi:hypothetical protein